MLFCMLYYENSNMDSQGNNNNTDSFEILICAWCCLPKTYQTLLQEPIIICDVLHDLAPFVQFQKTEKNPK